jgi:hypothetical protein
MLFLNVWDMILNQCKLKEEGTPELLAQGDNLFSVSIRDLFSVNVKSRL